MTTKYGVFKEPTYIGIGDAYATNKQEKTEAELGLNLKATKRRTGKGNDATFDRFKPLYHGERYIDPQRAQLMQQSEKRKKNITDNSWKPASPMKFQPGVGSYYGTFGGKIPYMTENPGGRLKKGEVPPGPPNIYTNPGKKGTFGYNKTTLSERQGAAGVVGEYSYKADPFEAGIKAVQDYEKTKQGKRISDSPFKPSNPGKVGGFGVPGTTLNGKGPGVAGEYGYVPLGPGERGKQGNTEVPFKPSHPPRNGYNATLNKFPGHVPDPEVPKMEAAREFKKSRREKLASQNPWRPSMTYRSDCTQSIIRMNV